MRIKLTVVAGGQAVCTAMLPHPTDKQQLFLSLTCMPMQSALICWYKNTGQGPAGLIWPIISGARPSTAIGTAVAGGVPLTLCHSLRPGADLLPDHGRPILHSGTEGTAFFSTAPDRKFCRNLPERTPWPGHGLQIKKAGAATCSGLNAQPSTTSCASAAHN